MKTLTEFISGLRQGLASGSPSHLYIMYNPQYNVYKIGRSGQPLSRLEQVRQTQEGPLMLIAVARGCGHLETDLHEIFKSQRIHPDVVRPDFRRDGTEWFLDSEELQRCVNAINSIASEPYELNEPETPNTENLKLYIDNELMKLRNDFLKYKIQRMVEDEQVMKLRAKLRLSHEQS